MRGRFHHRVSLASRLALLALLSSLLVGEFVHTDDGCEVERHCQACRLVLSPADTAQAPHRILRFAAPAGLVTPEEPKAPIRGDVRTLASRGPPAV
jgi:hypothetical protein